MSLAIRESVPRFGLLVDALGDVDDDDDEEVDFDSMVLRYPEDDAQTLNGTGGSSDDPIVLDDLELTYPADEVPWPCADFDVSNSNVGTYGDGGDEEGARNSAGDIPSRFRPKTSPSTSPDIPLATLRESSPIPGVDVHEHPRTLTPMPSSPPPPVTQHSSPSSPEIPLSILSPSQTPSVPRQPPRKRRRINSSVVKQPKSKPRYMDIPLDLTAWLQVASRNVASRGPGSMASSVCVDTVQKGEGVSRNGGQAEFQYESVEGRSTTEPRQVDEGKLDAPTSAGNPPSPCVPSRGSPEEEEELACMDENPPVIPSTVPHEPVKLRIKLPVGLSLKTLLPPRLPSPPYSPTPSPPTSSPHHASPAPSNPNPTTMKTLVPRCSGTRCSNLLSLHLGYGWKMCELCRVRAKRYQRWRQRGIPITNATVDADADIGGIGGSGVEREEGKQGTPDSLSSDRSRSTSVDSPRILANPDVETRTDMAVDTEIVKGGATKKLGVRFADEDEVIVLGSSDVGMGKLSSTMMATTSANDFALPCHERHPRHPRHGLSPDLRIPSCVPPPPTPLPSDSPPSGPYLGLTKPNTSKLKASTIGHFEPARPMEAYQTLEKLVEVLKGRLEEFVRVRMVWARWYDERVARMREVERVSRREAKEEVEGKNATTPTRSVQSATPLTSPSETNAIPAAPSTSGPVLLHQPYIQKVSSASPHSKSPCRNIPHPLTPVTSSSTSSQPWTPSYEDNVLSSSIPPISSRRRIPHAFLPYRVRTPETSSSSIKPPCISFVPSHTTTTATPLPTPPLLPTIANFRRLTFPNSQPRYTVPTPQSPSSPTMATRTITCFSFDGSFSIVAPFLNLHDKPNKANKEEMGLAGVVYDAKKRALRFRKIVEKMVRAVSGVGGDGGIQVGKDGGFTNETFLTACNCGCGQSVVSFRFTWQIPMCPLEPTPQRMTTAPSNGRFDGPPPPTNPKATLSISVLDDRSHPLITGQKYLVNFTLLS